MLGWTFSSVEGVKCMIASLHGSEVAHICTSTCLRTRPHLAGSCLGEPVLSAALFRFPVPNRPLF